MQPVKAPPPEMTPEEHRLQFSSIFKTEFSYVWNTLARMGVGARDLEDLTHEVFCHVYRQLPQYDIARPLRPWLFGFAFRLASDYRRLARHRTKLAAHMGDHRDLQPLADDQLISREDQLLVEAALTEVPLERRAILMLHEIDGYSIPEVARALSLPLNTAYSRLRLARADLVEAFRRLEKKGLRHGER